MRGQAKRKRKVAVATPNEEKENESDTHSTIATNEPAFNNGPMYKIMSHIQTSEALHKKYIKDLQQLYAKMDHRAFISTFIHMIKAAMACDETNEYAMTSLQFCAKFIASFGSEETHPVLASILEWLLGTISNLPHIRFRLCQFINMILTALGLEAALDDNICDKILEYMSDRILDVSPNVRVQAVYAMTRLQIPDNANDSVVRTYQFHLSSDPSPRVRIAVLKCMGRNVLTVPYILDRLFDIDEKVRKSTYLEMSSYPVRSYMVSQRLLLLEQGLNDRCETVRKVASKIMLKQWWESYKKDVLQLIAGLKLDATEADIERFRKVTKQTLFEIFKLEDPKFLIELLPFDTELEFYRCVPFEKLTMEAALYWQCLTEFLQTETLDEFDLVLPELTIFCAYTEKFCLLQNSDMDKFENLEFQYKLLPLLEILFKYDLGDEIGRGNLKKLLEFLLKKVVLNDRNREIVIRCAENVITDQSERMQYLIGIVSEICQLNPTQSNLWQDRTLVNEALSNCADSALQMKLTGLKVKILDLEEQESNLLQAKQFAQAEKVTKEKDAVTEEFSNLLKPLLAQPLEIRKVNNEDIITGLQIIFHMIVSKKVRSLNPQDCKLYKDFICRQMASTTTLIRIWAFKCGTAFSMHFEQIAKEVFAVLYSQFFSHAVEKIWETSMKCIFEIIDLYGINKFECSTLEKSSTNTTGSTIRRGGRLLYNTLENIDLDDGDDQIEQQKNDNEVGFIQLMSHFLDTLSSEVLISEILLGFSRLILHGHINSGDIIEKLLLYYFNPTTNTKISQYLGIFMQEMIRLRKQTLLIPSLLPTINAVLTAPYDSPLLEIRPETITRFFIDITRQDPTNQTARHNNLHNKIAHAFLTEMTNNVNNREIAKLLSKEILSLELNIINNPSLKNEMKEITDKLLACELEARTLKNLADFKEMLDGRFTRATSEVNESDNEADDDTVTNENQPRTSNTTPINEAVTTTTATTSNATTPAPSVIEEENESTLTETQAEANVQNLTNSQSTVTVAANADDESAVSGMENSSQQSLISTDSQVQQSIVERQQTSTNATKVITTTLFGSQNKVGQRCLRRSLNNSRTQSESEASVDMPKIRIECRIDSDKKKKTVEKTNNEVKKKNTQNTKTPTKTASSRTLRMLGRQQKEKSPEVTDKRNNEETTTTKTTTEINQIEELNDSEIIVDSPQATQKTTSRIFPTTRQRRINTTATTGAVVSSPTRSKRLNASQNTSSPRQSPQKTPTASPNKTNSPKTMTPTRTEKGKESQKQATTKTQRPQAKTSTSAENTETPQQQATKTPSRKTKTATVITTTATTETNVTSTATKSAEKAKTPQQQASKPINPNTKTPITTVVQSSINVDDLQGDIASNLNAAKAKTPNRLPRKAIYISATTTLQQRSSRKRHLPKTPHPNKGIRSTASIARKSDSSSSGTPTRSPKRKQARRSSRSPITPESTTIQTPNQQKRLTAKDIESLLNESSDDDNESHSSKSSASSPKFKKKTPTKKPTKAKAFSTIKKSNKNKRNLSSSENRRRKSLVKEMTSSNLSSEDDRIRNTRNKAKEAYRQQNIMTRKRKSVHNSSGSGGAGSSSTIPTKHVSPNKTVFKKPNVAKSSRIPVKSSSQSSRTASSTSTRSSSASPLRRGRTAAIDNNLRPPSLRTNSLGRGHTSRISRIPRKLP